MKLSCGIHCYCKRCATHYMLTEACPPALCVVPLRASAEHISLNGSTLRVESEPGIDIFVH